MIGYVDAAGVATQRVVSPITVGGGQLVAFDSASGRAREFAIHRITSVVCGATERIMERMPPTTMQSEAMRRSGADDRRTADRAVRQDGAARGRP